MDSIYQVVSRETAEILEPEYPRPLAYIGCGEHDWKRSDDGTHYVCERAGCGLTVQSTQMYFPELHTWYVRYREHHDTRRAAVLDSLDFVLLPTGS